MLRTITGVIVGYLFMAVFIFLAFTLVYLAMGADGAFKPGSYDVSLLWIVISVALSLLAAVLGGYLCAWIAKSRKAPAALAGLVVVFSLAMCVPVLMKADSEPPAARSGEVGNLDAMQKAKQPAWVMLLNPFIGAAGILVGGRLRKEP